MTIAVFLIILVPLVQSCEYLFLTHLRNLESAGNRIEGLSRAEVYKQCQIWRNNLTSTKNKSTFAHTQTISLAQNSQEICEQLQTAEMKDCDKQELINQYKRRRVEDPREVNCWRHLLWSVQNPFDFSIVFDSGQTALYPFVNDFLLIEHTDGTRQRYKPNTKIIADIGEEDGKDSLSHRFIQLFPHEKLTIFLALEEFYPISKTGQYKIQALKDKGSRIGLLTKEDEIIELPQILETRDPVFGDILSEKNILQRNSVCPCILPQNVRFARLLESNIIDLTVEQICLNYRKIFGIV